MCVVNFVDIVGALIESRSTFLYREALRKASR